MDDMKTVASLKAAIMDLVNWRATTFIEVSELPGASGPFDLMMGDTNNVIWAGLSHEAITAVAELRAAGAVHYHPSGPLPYLCGGMTLGLPTIKTAAALGRRTKRDRWLPVYLMPGRG